MNDIEQQFFKVFGIEPRYIDGCELNDKYFADEQLQKEYETLDDFLVFECPHQNEFCYSTCQYAYDCSEYPEITAEKLLQMEDLFANNKMQESGFYGGFHFYKEKEYNGKIFYKYRLNYYKGGYYYSTLGYTRKEALLKQLIYIANDKDIKQKEKDFLTQQVRSLFEEGND